MPEDKDKANALDLYKMEYQTAATRYQNIYTALWQNFSYIVVVSGAILTFSKDTLGIYVSGFLACLPLLFWYWATFVPLNRYGDQVGRRLAAIEEKLNADFKSELGLFIEFNKRPGEALGTTGDNPLKSTRNDLTASTNEKQPKLKKILVAIACVISLLLKKTPVAIACVIFLLVFILLSNSVFHGILPFFEPEHHLDAASGVRIIVFLIAILGLIWAGAFFLLRFGIFQSLRVRSVVNIGAMFLHLVVMTLPLLWMLHAEKTDVFAVRSPTPSTVVTLTPPDLKTLQEEQSVLTQIQKDTDAIKKKLKIQ